jgi:nitrogen regulatory protein PII
MKAIIAFIRPSMEEAVRDALHDMENVSGASFSDIRGFGRGRGHSHSREKEDELLVGTVPKLRVEVMVNDDVAEQVANVIATAAHTGMRGDGKVFTYSLETALRISTRESGASAV